MVMKEGRGKRRKGEKGVIYSTARLSWIQSIDLLLQGMDVSEVDEPES